MSYYVTHENSVLNINNAHLKVSGNVQTDVMKLGAIEFAPPESDVPGTVNFTNVTTGVTTTSNLNVGGTLMLGSVELVASTSALEQTVNLGNTTSNTVQFTNATTGFVTTANVGVGTVSPLVTLDTHGTMRSSAPYPRFDFYTTTNRSTNAWGNSTDNAGDYRIYSNGDASDGTKRSLNFDYGQNSTHATRMTINANGNVGINTSSPASGLHVRNSGGADVPSSIIIQPASTQYGRGHAKIEAYPDATVGAGTGLKFYTREDSGADFDPASLVAARMTIANDGLVGIGTEHPSRLFHVHKNLPTTSHHIMARIGGDTSSYNTLVFGSKEGRPHIGGHRGDIGAWADLSLQDDKLIISQGGNVNVNGTLQIQGFNAKRVLIGYQRFTTTSSSHSGSSHSSWLDRWTVNYTRKHPSSRIYAKGFIAVGQALGGTNNVSYRETYARFKVTQHNGSTSTGDSVRGWQRIDNSFHEYQRHVHIDVNEGLFAGTGANQYLTFTVQTYAGAGTGHQTATGINIWTGRSFIEVYETMVA